MNNFTLSKESKNIFKECVKKYKEEFDEEIGRRKYKWVALKSFQDNWNIDAKDFKKMIDSSIPKKVDFLSARLNGTHQHIKDLIIELIDNKKDVRKYFKNLYDEGIELEDRFENFQRNFTFKINKKDTSLDARNFSVLLALRYPEKYFMYQSRVIRCVKKSLNIEGKMETKLEGFKEGCCIFNKLRDIVLEDKGLLRKIDSYINKNKDMYSDDKEYYFLVQDICWSILQW